MDSTIRTPLFSFGVIADVQYADSEDGTDFHKKRERHYRHSLKVLHAASTHWKSLGTPDSPKGSAASTPLSFVLQLGDLIDGKCRQLGNAEQALELVLKELEGFTVHHLVGNHELYNFPRSVLDVKLNGNPNPQNVGTGTFGNKCAYYDVKVHPEWRLVILDGYDISVIGPETREEAIKFLSKYNPNDIRSNNVDWTAGLTGLGKRFMPYNGKISSKQLEWLTSVLADASSKNEKVLMACHIPICPGSCGNETLLWNYEEVMAIVHSFSCVKAFFSGHDHQGGYKQDEKKIHHKTLEAALEAPIGSVAYGIVDVFDDQIVVHGEGMVEQSVWKL